MNILCLLDRGPLSYAEVDGVQREIHAAVARGEEPDTLIVWQAKDVYTAGRRTRPEDVPDPSVPVVKVDRGGSVTYHGPGQVIVYPIVRVRLPKDVVAFVRAVEAAVIEALSTFGVRGERIAGRSGVWVGGEDRDIHFDSMLYGQGASMALPVWGLYMQKVYADKALGYSQEETFQIPEGFDPCSDILDAASNTTSSEGLDDIFE